MIITIENGRDIRLTGITPKDAAIVPWLDDLDHVATVIKPRFASEVLVCCTGSEYRDIVINNIKLLQEAV